MDISKIRQKTTEILLFVINIIRAFAKDELRDSEPGIRIQKIRI